MSDFKVIESQEQLDAIIADRVARAERKGEETAAEKYADYEELKAQAQALQDELNKAKNDAAEVETFRAKVHQYEIDSVKTKIAHEEGLPFEFAARLNGEDEETIRKDARDMAKLIKPAQGAPLGGAEPVQTQKPSKEDAYRQMARELQGD